MDIRQRKLNILKDCGVLDATAKELIADGQVEAAISRLTELSNMPASSYDEIINSTESIAGVDQRTAKFTLRRINLIDVSLRR